MHVFHIGSIVCYFVKLCNCAPEINRISISFWDSILCRIVVLLVTCGTAIKCQMSLPNQRGSESPPFAANDF